MNTNNSILFRRSHKPHTSQRIKMILLLLLLFAIIKLILLKPTANDSIANGVCVFLFCSFKYITFHSVQMYLSISVTVNAFIML